jgi:hypothetical protein
MSTSSPFCRPEEDPVLLIESCFRAIQWQLRLHQGQPLRRTWIDQPYGEEELTRLEQEVLPAMEGFLQRLQEIDAELLAAQDAEAEALEAAEAEASVA